MTETSVSDRKRVLLVDDDPNVILLVKEYLEFRGVGVITAESSRKALEILEQDIPDLIVSDVMRAEMNGFDFVRIIQQNVLTRSIPFLFLSATGCQLESRIKGLNLGADAFMPKPFEPEELAAQVEALLRKVYRSTPSSETSFEQANREEQSLKETSVRSRKRLLVVDNDLNCLLLIKPFLELRGIEVITAKNGREALEILEQELPDLIVSEVTMPEMDGYAFLDNIRQNERTSWIPVLFLSNQRQSQDIINGLNLGADAFMTKPCEPEELAAQIAALLRQIYRRCPSSKNGFAEGVRQPYIILSDYSGDYPTQTLVVYPAAGGKEVTTAGYAAAKPLPYYFASELDEYPPSTLVVWVTPWHQEARAAGYNNAVPLPYYFASESDEYPPSTLVVRVWDQEARAAGYNNAVRLNNSLPYIEDLGMLDTEYATMLQAEEQNSA